MVTTLYCSIEIAVFDCYRRSKVIIVLSKVIEDGQSDERHNSWPQGQGHFEGQMFKMCISDIVS